MVNARVAHITELNVFNVCCVCGDAKETSEHFFFECKEAVLFWAQICTIFPLVQTRNRAEMLLFKRQPISGQAYAFENEERVTDDAVAEALFARWKERCKTSIQLNYLYCNLKVWTNWSKAMRLRYQDGVSPTDAGDTAETNLVG